MAKRRQTDNGAPLNPGLPPRFLFDLRTLLFYLGVSMRRAGIGIHGGLISAARRGLPLQPERERQGIGGQTALSPGLTKQEIFCGKAWF